MSGPFIVSIGECMVEVSGSIGGASRLSYGGDTLNTATYLSRLGARAHFLTALGVDEFSQEMKAAWAKDGIGLELLLTHPTRVPGLYAIRTRDDGERTFIYWRSESAARDLFALPEAEAALARAAEADLLYLSGITLSMFGAEHRARLAEVVQAVRARGGQVAFDPNYRARGWVNAGQAREAFAAFAPHVSIALPTFDDEAQLYDDADAEAVAKRWRAAGAGEVVVKLGALGALVSADGDDALVEQRARPHAADTTGAGDSFNAAYLAARLRGLPPSQAARAGNHLAACVVTHLGAIIAADKMPDMQGLERAS